MEAKPPGMPSAIAVSRVTIPWRSSISSARARIRGPAEGASAKSGAVSDQRPSTVPAAAARRRAKRRPPRSLRWAARRRGARSGAKASLVTSPDQARSQSASWSSSAEPSRSSRSSQKQGPWASRSRIASWISPSGRSSFALRRRRAGEPDVLAEVESDLAVVAPEGPGADPDQLAARAELVEPGRAVGAESPGQHVALPGLRRQRDALQRDQRLAQAIGPGAGAAVGVDVLPARQEAGELALVGRLDLLAQPGEAGAAQPAQDVGLAPLARGAAGEELAADDVAGALQLLQRRSSGRRRSGRRAARWGRGRGCAA